MRNLIIVCLVFVSGLVQGQKTSGRIIYETSRDIAKTLAKAKFLSKEEKDMLPARSNWLQAATAQGAAASRRSNGHKKRKRKRIRRGKTGKITDRSFARAFFSSFSSFSSFRGSAVA
jgi:hypothetical protein